MDIFLNKEILLGVQNVASLASQTYIEIPLSHVFLFALFLLIFFLMGSTRGIALTSFIFALNLGITQNMGMLMEGVTANPVLWIPYILVGTLFFVILMLGLINYN